MDLIIFFVFLPVKKCLGGDLTGILEKQTPHATSSPRHLVVERPHYPVFAGGADFHFLTGKLVEEKRRAVGVHHLAVCVHAQTGIGRDKIDAFRIFSHERGGDFGVRADGIFAERGIVIVDGHARLVQNRQRREILNVACRRSCHRSRIWRSGAQRLVA